MSQPSDFQRLDSLFHELVDLGADERRARLAELRDAEPGLHARLVRLLEKDEAGTERALDEVVGGLGGEPRLGAGDRVGPYRLVRELGEGGMGVVFEAEQEAPLERRVALKLVRGGLGGPRLLDRFEAERGTLARMSHPAIAQVFDAGTAPDGRPYLAMELVEGEPITRFCDQRRLTTADRIGLFRQVCEAVQHAHQKGVLHRDLKPGNILVSSPAGEPRVKVIDFGIAKLTDAEAGPGLTRLGEIVGTPEYMSPEQTRGGDVDTRSDVYSLGVVLYELLTGRVPIDRESFDSASPVEIAHLVGERPPTPPEARLTPGTAESEEIAARRRSDPARLRRELRGDLGRILMMALRKEPERRYGSAEQLSTDVAHYLEGRPVVARPDSLGYRASKLVRRHKAAVAAAGLLLVGLVGATAFSTRMYLRAEAARQESEAQRVATEQINEFLKDMLGSIDPELARGRDISLLREVLDDAARKLDTELAELPAVRAGLGLTVGRAYESIGREAEAEERLRASLETLRGLSPPPRAELAEAELALGWLLTNRDRYPEAEALLRSAVERRRAQSPQDEPALAAALTALAHHLEDVGGYDEAARLFEEALALLRRQPEPDVDALATTLCGYGEHLMNHHRMAEAEAPLREAIAIRRAAGEEGPSLVLPLSTLGRWLRWSDRLDEAVEPASEAVAIARREMPEDHPLRLDVISSFANLQQHRGEHGTAEALYRETLEAQRRVHGARHSAVATTTNNLASLLLELGRLEESERLFAEAAEAYRESLGPDHYWVSISRFNRARALFRLGRVAEAERELRDARRIRTQHHDSERWQEAEVDVLLAACRVEQGELGGAEAVILRGVEAIRAHYGEATDRVDVGLRALLAIYQRDGRTAEAAALRRRVELAADPGGRP
ncbi:MAG TPA: serine/threonine-protein kinase [Thermoanaerobaculia bacterium]|nr:serine/threonine-protein kinase [Thermoanaerobaculia bacterium]